MSKTIIEIKDLHKEFKNSLVKKDKTEVLKGINLNIEEQQRIALVGKNGSGKTTLAKIIAGYSELTSGEIIYNYDYLISPKESIALQFQNEIELKKPTVKDLYKLLITNFKEILDMEFIKKLYEILQIEKYLKMRYDRLSGGQRKKVDLFFVLYSKPKLLILDEFTAGLDADTKIKVRDIIESYINKYNGTMLLISHDSNEIRKLTNEIYVLKDGVISDHITNIQEKFVNDDDLELFIRDITESIKNIEL